MFDEADMLLCGSFQNKVIRLINLLRFDEKLLSRSKVSVAELPMELESSLSSHDALEVEEELPTEATSEDVDDDDDNDDDDDDIANINNEALSVKRRDRRRVRKNYKRSKQYVFVAATLPKNGKKTAGAILKHMFPDAEWVSGNYLHCHNPRCFLFSLLVLFINKNVSFFCSTCYSSAVGGEIIACIHQEY